MTSAEPSSLSLHSISAGEGPSTEHPARHLCTPCILANIHGNTVVCFTAGQPNVSQQTTFSHLQTTVNVTVFADCLRRQSVYTDPADSADKFADQLEQSVVSVLDELAPLKTCSKRCGRWSNRWLSESGVAAKRKQRRLERRWYRTRRQADRVVYRSASRKANAEIIKSRGHSTSNDSTKRLAIMEHNGELFVSCSTQMTTASNKKCRS